MNIVASGLLVGIVAWLGLCGGLAAWVFRQQPRRPLLREQGLALIGTGLLALAPCTYLAMLLSPAAPSLVPSAVQLAGAVLLFAAAWQARRGRLNPDSAGGTWAFPQKSAAVVLLALLVLSFSYFSGAWELSGSAAVARFINAIILLIVLMIVGHIVIAVFHSPLDELEAARDERDRRVDLYSMRNAYVVLTVAFWTFPVMLIAQPPLVKALNIWFSLLVVAEIVYYSSVIAYYRFGTD